MDIGVRTAGDPLSLAPAISAAVRSVDREQPITDLLTMERSIHNRAIGLNYMAVLMGVFGLLALCLSAIGVYGVMAYMVSEQTHEIGIRMALGARAADVLKLVVRNGMGPVLLGATLGLAGAVGLSRLMASFLFGVTPTDALTLATVSAGLILIALVACYIPARRATKVDPLIALRYE
jgi:putative ABC transport system permease protein